MMMGHGLWLVMPFLLLGKLFWLVLLVFLISFLVRRFSYRRRYMPFWGYPTTSQSQPSALEVLRQRYARGEIDATTFEHMRERLEATQQPRQQ